MRSNSVEAIAWEMQDVSRLQPSLNAVLRQADVVAHRTVRLLDRLNATPRQRQQFADRAIRPTANPSESIAAQQLSETDAFPMAGSRELGGRLLVQQIPEVVPRQLPGCTPNASMMSGLYVTFVTVREAFRDASRSARQLVRIDDPDTAARRCTSSHDVFSVIAPQIPGRYGHRRTAARAPLQSTSQQAHRSFRSAFLWSDASDR
jgi:hypothetical protein